MGYVLKKKKSERKKKRRKKKKALDKICSINTKKINTKEYQRRIHTTPDLKRILLRVFCCKQKQNKKKKKKKEEEEEEEKQK